MKVYVASYVYDNDIIGITKSIEGCDKLIRKIAEDDGYADKIRFTTEECYNHVIGSYIFYTRDKGEETAFIIEEFELGK